MSEEKKQPKKEGCPLCDVSEETLKRLKASRDKKTEDNSAGNNERSENRK